MKRSQTQGRRSPWLFFLNALICLLVAFTISMRAQSQPRFRLVYILLLDVKGVDPTYKPNKLDPAIKLVMNQAEIKFGDSMAVRFKPLRDSADGCQTITDARDCDVVILREGPHKTDSSRFALSLEWMCGANRHPTLDETRPIPPHSLRCSNDTGLSRCRLSMRNAIIRQLTEHFHSPAAGHMSP